MCKIKLFITILLLTIVCTSGASTNDPNDTITTTEDTIVNNSTVTDEYNRELINKLRLVPLSDAINDFGMQLIRKLNNETDKTKNVANIAFSPLSISQMFSMILSSAQNQTLEELMNALGFANQLQTSQNVNNAYQLLLSDYDKSKLEQSGRLIKLSLPSLALYSNDFNIRKGFRKNLKENYRTDASKVDFTNDQAVSVTNEFVNKNTNGSIKNLIEKMDPETKLALANAFYFKGEWVNQFDKGLVKNRLFTNADQTTKQVQMMFKRDHHDYFEDDDIQVIVLPYLGNASMTILLPQKNKTVDNLISNLNSSLIDYYRYQMKENSVELILPKLKIENTIDLKKPLVKMGITKVFSTEAELPGITSSKGVYISQAIHKAYIDINEQGILRKWLLIVHSYS